ncbi:MAG: glycosyltransferase [Turneriella sp.]
MHKPLVVAVTRLTGQKIRLFFDTIAGKQVLQQLSEMPMHVIFLGKGDLMQKLADEIAGAPNVLLFGGFDDELEKRLYASADCMLMPSEFEPCGTSQMKSMRYGCLPIASAVGGLSDTIRHDFNGFLYAGTDRRAKAGAFLQLVRGALEMIQHDKGQFLKMQRNAMLTDFSWTEAAESYLQLMKP